MITIYWTGGSKQIEADDSSCVYRSLMRESTLTLKFTLSEFIEFPIGASCSYQGEKYILLTPPNIKKNGERSIEYTLEMGTDANNLRSYRFRNAEDKRLKFSMCAKPSEFLRQIIENLNNHDGADVWTAGKCIDATEKTIEFNHTDILSALSSIAEAFDTEWEISSHVIYLCKVEYNKEAPLPLSYGKGNGFVPGVGRISAADSQPIGRLYVQGGEKNINPSKYKSKYLLLPRSQRLTYEGCEYISSADGLSVCNVNNQGVKTLREDSLDLSDIYPKRVGKVSAVETKSVDKHFYDILDNSIPDTLNYGKHLIEGEKMTIIFQSGMLAGKEFDVKYKHAERRFEIVPQEYDGVTMPNETFKPAIGNEYAIFNVTLPDAYICDNTTQSGASWDIMREACKYLKEHEEQKFTFTGELQGLWAKKNWLNVGGKLKVGGYVRFSDPQFAPNGVDIRIVGIKEHISDPHAPILELSNDPKGTSFSSTINKIEQQEVVVEESKRDVIAYTKRRFRDAKETLTMLEGALSYFSGAINPVAISTMALLVGDESLQFVYVDNSGNDVLLSTKYDVHNKVFSIPATRIKHMTIGMPKDISPNKGKIHPMWNIKAFTSPPLTDGNKKYYVYVKVNKDYLLDIQGFFVLSEVAIQLEEEKGCYHFLAGILNSEFNNERSFVALNGFTEILPSRITTERIVSANGKNFIDLAGNAIHLGGNSDYLDWNNEEPSTLVLSNAKIKNALKVIGEAVIAGFKFSDSEIKSVNSILQQNTFYPSIRLDGNQGIFEMRSAGSASQSWYQSGTNSTIRISSSDGTIEAKNNDGFARQSVSGFFCNNPMTSPYAFSTGFSANCCFVSLAFGNKVMKNNSQFVAGYYGEASNNMGDAPTYGGYFVNLMASGLCFKVLHIDDNAATKSVMISRGVTQIIGVTNEGKEGVVVLPQETHVGRVIFAKQHGRGTMKFQTIGNQVIYDDWSQNTYYTASSGEELKFTFNRISINGANKDIWLVSRFRF